jgi:DNA-binding XRE family transcriptional regulator
MGRRAVLSFGSSGNEAQSPFPGDPTSHGGDQKKPVVTRLTYDHPRQSLCRVLSDRPDDDQWLSRERQRVGGRIRAARLNRNLTQEAVFLAVPLNRSYYQDVEAGRANPTLETLLSIARVLDMPLAELVR